MADTYASLLEAQIVAVEHFMQVLEVERHQLTDAGLTIDQLAATTEAKQTAAARMDRLENERRHLAGQLGAAIGTDDALAARLSLTDTWAQLLDRIRAARQANLHNGEAIDVRLSHTNRALASLQRNNPPALYAADGQRRPSQPGRWRSGA